MFAVHESIFHFKVFRVLEDSHPRQNILRSEKRHILCLFFILRDKKFQFFHLFKVLQLTVEIWEFI